ncbi:MAG: hypothetical protein JNM56_15550 [Planctomycetia bacterium]|nr:hypothetical protein [Planctomycetia bacterium]
MLANFAFLVALAGLVAGAVYGGMDNGAAGGVVGGLLGAVAGALLGEALDLVITPFFRKEAKHGPGAWVVRLIGLALLLVFAHELWWMTNLVTLAMAHNVGSKTTQYTTSHADNPTTVRDHLKDLRWQAAPFTGRPTRWGMKSEVTESSKAATGLIDDVAAQKQPVDQSLYNRGKELAEKTEKLIDQFVQRTLLLRFLPRDVLLPKE